MPSIVRHDFAEDDLLPVRRAHHELRPPFKFGEQAAEHLVASPEQVILYRFQIRQNRPKLDRNHWTRSCQRVQDRAVSQQIRPAPGGAIEIDDTDDGSKIAGVHRLHARFLHPCQARHVRADRNHAIHVVRLLWFLENLVNFRLRQGHLFPARCGEGAFLAGRGRSSSSSCRPYRRHR